MWLKLLLFQSGDILIMIVCPPSACLNFLFALIRIACFPATGKSCPLGLPLVLFYTLCHLCCLGQDAELYQFLIIAFSAIFQNSLFTIKVNVNWNKQHLLDTRYTVMVNKENYYQEYKGHTKWLSLICSHFAKKIVFAWCSFMHMLIIHLFCMCKVSESFSKSSGTSCFLKYALSKHNHNPYLIGKNG